MVSTMNTYMGELRTKTSAELETIKYAYEQQQQAFVVKLKEQQEALSQKTEEMNKVLQGIQSLSDAKAAINSLADVSRNNARQLQQITRVLESMDFSGSQNFASGGENENRRHRGGGLSSVLNNSVKIAALIAFVLFVIEFITGIVAR